MSGIDLLYFGYDAPSNRCTSHVARKETCGSDSFQIQTGNQRLAVSVRKCFHTLGYKGLTSYKGTTKLGVLTKNWGVGRFYYFRKLKIRDRRVSTFISNIMRSLSKLLFRNSNLCKSFFL